MKKNKLLRYFKTSSIPDVISCVLILAGIIIYWYSFEIWMLGTPILVLGVVGLILSFAFKVSDQTYEDYFTKRFEELPRERELEPEAVFTEYAFEGNHYAKLDKLGTPRSETCVRTVIYFDKQLKVVRGIVNLEAGTEDVQTFAFDTASASVDNIEAKVGGSTKKLAMMTIASGEESCRFPVKYNDIEVDQFMERLNKRYVG